MAFFRKGVLLEIEAEEIKEVITGVCPADTRYGYLYLEVYFCG